MHDFNPGSYIFYVYTSAPFTYSFQASFMPSMNLPIQGSIPQKCFVIWILLEINHLYPLETHAWGLIVTVLLLIRVNIC